MDEKLKEASAILTDTCINPRKIQLLKKKHIFVAIFTNFRSNNYTHIVNTT